MGMTPNVFWSLTIPEWRAALNGFSQRQGQKRKASPLTHTDLTALMNRFPDES